MKIDLTEIMPFLIEKGLEKAEVYVEFPISIWIQRKKPVPSHIILFKIFETKDDYDRFIENESDTTQKEIYKIVKFRDDVEWTKDFEIKIYVCRVKDVNRIKRYRQDDLIRSFDVKLYEAEEVEELGSLEQYVKNSKREIQNTMRNAVLSSSSSSFLSNITAEQLVQLVKFLKDSNLISFNVKDDDEYYEVEKKNIKSDIDDSLFKPNQEIQSNIQTQQNQQSQQNQNFFDYVIQGINVIKSLNENNITKEQVAKEVNEAIEKVKIQYEMKLNEIRNQYESQLKDRDSQIKLLSEKLNFYITELNNLRQKEKEGNKGGGVGDDTIIHTS
ncbi:MAG: hypothetical protein RMJ67_01180 [Elusimicrobiota bacterium]|nr:hypothetical protein [Endomicrobiia bacterium]MDW8165116.1 hypothetical protein [Elusimicrobiota bacterium]